MLESCFKAADTARAALEEAERAAALAAKERAEGKEITAKLSIEATKYLVTLRLSKQTKFNNEMDRNENVWLEVHWWSL